MCCASYTQMQFVLTLQYNYAGICSIFFFFEGDLFLRKSSLEYVEVEIYLEPINVQESQSLYRRF